MKNLLLILNLILVNNLFSQVTYVNFFDAAFPSIDIETSYPPIDINSDGQFDFYIQSQLGNDWSGSISFKRYIGSYEGNIPPSNQFFISFLTVNSNNQFNGNSIDCTNQIMGVMGNGMAYNSSSKVRLGYPFSIMGLGTHKQGFLIKTNAVNPCVKYGYIDYTYSSDYSIIVHGWYYQNTCSEPILANSQLTFPSDLNCLQLDTVTLYDTITTNTTIYDTITTNITTYVTLLVSVTDTLFINTSLGLTAPNNTNAIMVYPNPANDHITIDNGNFALMSNYTLKIENSLGQQVFSSLVNQQQFYVDLNGWSGNGVYFLKLINPQNNIVTIRKIVLQ